MSSAASAAARPDTSGSSRGGPVPLLVIATAQLMLVLDDSTLDKPYAQKIGLVTRHWSGKHKAVVRGVNLATLLWTDGDRKLPVDYRLYSKADGKSKHDHFWEMLLMAEGRGFEPRYVLFVVPRVELGFGLADPPVDQDWHGAVTVQRVLGGKVHEGHGADHDGGLPDRSGCGGDAGGDRG